jgi:hypothetical protein
VRGLNALSDGFSSQNSRQANRFTGKDGGIRLMPAEIERLFGSGYHPAIANRLPLIHNYLHTSSLSW